MIPNGIVVECGSIPPASNVGGGMRHTWFSYTFVQFMLVHVKKNLFWIISVRWLDRHIFFSTDAPFWSDFNLSETKLPSLSSSQMNWSGQNAGKSTGIYLVQTRGKTERNHSPASTNTVSPYFTFKIEVGSGYPRRLWRSMEGWRVVCDWVLWHVPSKIS